MGKILKDFKDFAMRGNVIDMAVGVIIGGAFGEIVSSLVDDLIMPVIGVLTGGMDFKDMKYALKPEVLDESGQVVQEAVTFNYGMFVQNVVDFLIVAFCIFMAIRIMSRFRKAEEKKAAEPAPPSQEVQLLEQIRDLLKDKK